MLSLAVLSLLSVAALGKSLSPEENAGLEVLFQDINSNRDEYVSYLAAAGSSGVDFPTQFISLYTAITTYTDDSYTTLFADINESDLSQAETIVANLPWYSSRILPAVEGALASNGAIPVTGASSAAVTTAAAGSNSTLTSTNSTALVSSANVAGNSSSVSSSSASSSSASKNSSSSSSAAASSSSSAGAAVAAAPQVLAGLSAGSALLAYLLI